MGGVAGALLPDDGEVIVSDEAGLAAFDLIRRQRAGSRAVL
jgi:hypothetical protein